MNSQALTKLKPYIFGLGDTNSAVGLLKTALKLHPNIPTANFQSNNTFDKNTQTAVAYVQKTKGLTPTGRMDFYTWLALGSEMSPIQIKSLFASDITLQNMLGLGYVMKHPERSTVSNNLMSNAVIHTSSSNYGSLDKWYDFTFLVYVTVFAPFNWFGPLDLSAGDGTNRPFGYDQNASYRLQCFSTVIAKPGDRDYIWTNIYKKTTTKVSAPTTSILMVPMPLVTFPAGIGLPGIPYPKIANSPGHLRREESLTDFDLPESDQISHGPYRLKYHFFGNDRAFSLLGGSSWLASDIDVHPNINFEYKPDKDNPKNITLRAYGNITGDQFPAVESYILDKNENGVMLGVWQVREGDGPVLTRNGRFGIEGDKQLPMFDIDVTVIVEDGIFTGVLKNGMVISLAEHNKYYTDLPTVKPQD
jgi:hypothetical protein